MSDNTKQLAGIFFWALMGFATLFVLFDPTSWLPSRAHTQSAATVVHQAAPPAPTVNQTEAIRRIVALFSTKQAKEEFSLNGNPSLMSDGSIRVDFWFQPGRYNKKGESQSHMRRLAELIAMKADYQKVTVRLFALGEYQKPIMTATSY